MRTVVEDSGTRRRMMISLLNGGNSAGSWVGVGGRLIWVLQETCSENVAQSVGSSQLLNRHDIKSSRASLRLNTDESSNHGLVVVLQQLLKTCSQANWTMAYHKIRRPSWRYEVVKYARCNHQEICTQKVDSSPFELWRNTITQETGWSRRTLVEDWRMRAKTMMCFLNGGNSAGSWAGVGGRLIRVLQETCPENVTQSVRGSGLLNKPDIKSTWPYD